MDTQTGRIFSPEEVAEYGQVRQGYDLGFEERLKAAELAEARMEALQAIHRADMSGRLAPVSPEVAQMVKLGQRELERRKRRRSAARAARRRNR